MPCNKSTGITHPTGALAKGPIGAQGRRIAQSKVHDCKEKCKPLAQPINDLEEPELPSPVEACLDIAYDTGADSGKVRGSGKMKVSGAGRCSLNKKDFETYQTIREKRVNVDLKAYERSEREEKRKEKLEAVARGRAAAERLTLLRFGVSSFSEEPLIIGYESGENSLEKPELSRFVPLTSSLPVSSADPNSTHPAPAADPTHSAPAADPNVSFDTGYDADANADADGDEDAEDEESDNEDSDDEDSNDEDSNDEDSDDEDSDDEDSDEDSDDEDSDDEDSDDEESDDEKPVPVNKSSSGARETQGGRRTRRPNQEAAWDARNQEARTSVGGCQGA